MEEKEKSPRYTCVVCGHKVYDKSHKCPDAVTRAADAAETRAFLDDLDPTRNCNEFWRGEGRRMTEGFDLMGLDGDGTNRD